MPEFIERDLTTLAICWRLDRRDGVTIGFTSHDRDLELDGLRYRSAPGMLPSAIGRSDGFDLDTMDVSGALSDAAIATVDLEAGRWDGAAVRVFGVDWEAPGEVVHLARGELGAVEMRDRAFAAELRGPTCVLERPVVEETSPECRAELGDKRCRVDLAARRRLVRVVGVEGAVVMVDAVEPSENAYGYGRLRWLGGLNAGLSGQVLSSDGDLVTLRDAPALGVAVGDLCELIEGCDKRSATCSGRFANVVNFRGEPHLPGNDLLTRYAGG